MVGIVFVSHSGKVAEGAVELASQMTRGAVALAAAGGDAAGGLGTDAARIVQAIQAVRGPDGVLILVDLGSAVMSAQLAVEMVGADDGEILLSNAPLIEGGVVAAVEASIGTSLQDVAAAATRAASIVKVDG